MVGGAPLVIKLLEGTQGIGVVLAETQKAAESVIEAFMGLNVNILVQEFIKEAGGADLRCFVIGDKVVATMKRQGKEGEFRSNLHRGGSATWSASRRRSAPPPCAPPRPWGSTSPVSTCCVPTMARSSWRSTPRRGWRASRARRARMSPAW
jgi:hypothetical protein